MNLEELGKHTLTKVTRISLLIGDKMYILIQCLSLMTQKIASYTSGSLLLCFEVIGSPDSHVLRAMKYVTNDMLDPLRGFPHFDIENWNT